MTYYMLHSDTTEKIVERLNATIINPSPSPITCYMKQVNSCYVLKQNTKLSGIIEINFCTFFGS